MKFSQEGYRRTLVRWLKFNLVGALGIGVQLASLTLLKPGLHLHYLLSTALAVEAAVIHNFIWHERFTWADRQSKALVTRFTNFNSTTGVFSIVANLIMMKLLVGVAHLPYLVANGLAIAACSIANFVVSDQFVFGAVDRSPAKRACFEVRPAANPFAREPGASTDQMLSWSCSKG